MTTTTATANEFEQMHSPLSEKLGRGNVMAAQCPSRVILQHLTSRWGVLVMIALRNHELRFGELGRRIEGVSERMLAQTLQALEADAMVNRRSLDTMPLHVEYSLTSFGKEAAERLLHLVDWLEVSLPEIEQAKAERAAAT